MQLTCPFVHAGPLKSSATWQQNHPETGTIQHTLRHIILTTGPSVRPIILAPACTARSCGLLRAPPAASGWARLPPPHHLLLHQLKSVSNAVKVEWCKHTMPEHMLVVLQSAIDWTFAINHPVPILPYWQFFPQWSPDEILIPFRNEKLSKHFPDMQTPSGRLLFAFSMYNSVLRLLQTALRRSMAGFPCLDRIVSAQGEACFRADERPQSYLVQQDISSFENAAAQSHSSPHCPDSNS